MALTETELAVRKPRWWRIGETLQTVAFGIGWIVGVPAGALAAIAWGLWSNQASYAAEQAKYELVLASNVAQGTRLGALERVVEAWSKERAINLASVNSRLTKLETEISPVVVTSDVISNYGAHLGGLDARAGAIEKRQIELQAQTASLCAKLAGIAGASGKKAVTCP